MRLAGLPGAQQAKAAKPGPHCLLAGRAGPGASGRRKAQISNWRAEAPASKQGQRSFQIKLAGRPGGRQAKFSYANLRLLAGPGASGHRKAQLSNCWRAPAPASKQRQISFQIKLVGRPGGRQAKFSYANLPLLVGPGQRSFQIKLAGRHGGRQGKFSHVNLCLLAGPGASERRKAQISNCWRAQAPASKPGQRSFQIKLAGRPGGRQAKFSSANLGASQRRKAQIRNCWRAPAPASKQAQRSFHIKLAGRPGGRQAKLSCASLCLLAGPGANEHRKAQIRNCWRALAPASKQVQRSFQIKLAGLAAGKQNFHIQTCACRCWRAQAPAGKNKKIQITACGAQVRLCCVAALGGQHAGCDLDTSSLRTPNLDAPASSH